MADVPASIRKKTEVETVYVVSGDKAKALVDEPYTDGGTVVFGIKRVSQ